MTRRFPVRDATLLDSLLETIRHLSIKWIYANNVYSTPRSVDGWH